MKEYENDDLREEKIIKHWKNIINEQDIVIHLGDVCFGGSIKLQEIMSLLPGRKILVLGNHDNKPPHYYMERGFDFACYSFTWKNFIFTHKPIQDTHGKINIHGHLHAHTGRHMAEYPWYSENQYLVSMEENSYRPTKLDDVKKLSTPIDKNEKSSVV
ncbi:MAG: hypothetical protein HGA25_03075 [Clostridiales bacterium]|nr:hypothetical protein [Clostridiales bacterium]